MKLLKGIIIFAVAFITAWILIFTFIQEPFKQTAAARILTLWTPPIPIYLYVAGAFGIGFAAGLAVALVNYVSLQSKLHHQVKVCGELKERLSEAEGRLKRIETAEPVLHDVPAFEEKTDGHDIAEDDEDIELSDTGDAVV